MGSEKLPSREVQNTATSLRVNRQIDKPSSVLEVTQLIGITENQESPEPQSENVRRRAEVEVQLCETRAYEVGSVKLPSREVQLHLPDAQRPVINPPNPTARITDMNVITGEADTQLLGELPEPAPPSLHPSIYTWQTDPFNATRVKEIK